MITREIQYWKSRVRHLQKLQDDLLKDKLLNDIDPGISLWNLELLLLESKDKVLRLLLVRDYPFNPVVIVVPQDATLRTLRKQLEKRVSEDICSLDSHKSKLKINWKSFWKKHILVSEKNTLSRGTKKRLTDNRALLVNDYNLCSGDNLMLLNIPKRQKRVKCPLIWAQTYGLSKKT